MFYEFSDDVVTVDIGDISQGSLVAGFINCDLLDTVAKQFSFSKQTVEQCSEEGKYFRSNIDVYDDYLFATLKLINPKDNDADSDCIAMYIKKNLFIVVDIYDKDYSVRDKFLNAIGRNSPSTVSLERLVYAFFESVINGDSRFLEDTEFCINKMEEQIFHNLAPENFNLNLLNTKQMLLLLRNYYEQLIDINEAFEENENELFDENELKYFRFLINKTKRLKDNVDMLRDSVVHLKEAYESALELRLNQTMKILTVFTVIFSPLTLITGWYGMNFAFMPELKWRLGYFIPIIISALTVAIIIFIFKKKKWI